MNEIPVSVEEKKLMATCEICNVQMEDPDGQRLIVHKASVHHVLGFIIGGVTYYAQLKTLEQIQKGL